MPHMSWLRARARMSRRVLAVCLGIGQLLSWQSAAWAATGLPANLNLASTRATIHAPQSATIVVGGAPQTFKAGSAITAAEAVAIAQVLSSGTQSIILGAHGNALGGSVVLPGAQVLSSLTVPQGVTLVRDFNGAVPFALTGSLTNAGSIYAVSTASAVSVADVTASSIVNKSGALISTILPAGNLGFSNAINNLSLSLTANSITNAGTISSAGHLLLNASGAGININNTGGTLQAADYININAAGAKASDLTMIVGGNLLAPTVNVNVANGTLNMDVNQMTGILNVTAFNAHVGAEAGTLTLGLMNVQGDPLAHSGNGVDIIASTGTFTEDYTILAGGSILIPNNGVINDSQHNITLIAGANVAPAGTGFKVSGGDMSGGNIICSSCSGTQAINTSFNSVTKGNGGNIFLGAFSGNVSSGSIDMSDVAFDSSTFTGKPGNITVIAPGNITFGQNVWAQGGTQSGAIKVVTATPTGTISVNSSGKVSGSLTAGKSLTTGGSITVTLTGSVNANSDGLDTGASGGTITFIQGGTFPMTIDGSVVSSGTGGVNPKFASNGASGGKGGKGGTITLTNLNGSIVGGGNIAAEGNNGGFPNTGAAGKTGGHGGNGGAGGVVTITAQTINETGSIFVTGGNGTFGGNGGNAGVSGQSGGNGGSAGAGAAAGTIKLIASTGAITVGNLTALGGSGGEGGVGGTAKSSSTGKGGNGGNNGVSGNGAKGGTIVITTPQNSVNITGEINVDGGQAVQLPVGAPDGASGKTVGGNGGSVGNAGNGGAGGKLVVTSPIVSITGGTTGEVHANGGTGGVLANAGAGAAGAIGGRGGNVGNAGAGGAGGAIQFTAPGTNSLTLLTGSIFARGGDGGSSGQGGSDAGQIGAGDVTGGTGVGSPGTELEFAL